MPCYAYPVQHAVNNQQASKRGVLWDQEIYDPFYYNQDRTFFHSFELEGCLAGLSFMDEKEAKQFKKKMDERENNASKQTKSTPFQGLGPALQPSVGSQTQGKSHGLFGGISSLLSSQRSSSAPHVSHQSPQSIIPPRQTNVFTPPSPNFEKRSLDDIDPKILDDLVQLGIPRDQLEEHIDFIKDYIEQQKSSEIPNTNSAHDASNEIFIEKRAKAPPPPPPAPIPTILKSLGPQHEGNTQSKRGPPPAPPPSRRSRPDSQNNIVPSSYQPSSPPESPARTPSPPRPVARFKAPPPIADAGKYAHTTAPVLPARPRATSNATNPGPPPPPRPPKTPMDDEPESRTKFNVPPPFHGERFTSTAPPAPPSRMPLRPSPRASREASNLQAVAATAGAPPPLPPKTPNAPIQPAGPPFPPPLPSQRNATSAPAPLPLPSIPRMVPNPPISVSGPPAPSPPPLPHSSGPPPPPLPGSAGPVPPPLPSFGAPLPPPLPHGSGPPPPPLPPGREPTTAPPLPKPTSGKEDVLASIRASGGIKGLKRVSSQEKRDRSAAAVPGVTEKSSLGGGAASAPSAGGGLAEALAAALSERNKKVSASGMLSKVLIHVKVFG